MYVGERKLSMDMQYENFAIKPVMPSLVELMDEFKEVTIELRKVDSDGMDWYDQSLCHTLNANTVPIIPDVDMREQGDLYEPLRQTGDSSIFFAPDRLVNHNVGQNRGMLLVFRELIDNINAERRKQYKFVISDVNIFIRIIKVCI